MKINLKASNDIRHGYLNIDDVKLDGVEESVYRVGHTDNLDWLCEDNTLEEIVSNDSIIDVPFDSIPATVKNWFSKLKPGGKLFVSIPSSEIVSKMLYHGTMTIQDFCKNIFGNKSNRKSGLDAITLTTILSEAGFSINMKFYDDIFIMNIEAIKP